MMESDVLGILVVGLGLLYTMKNNKIVNGLTLKSLYIICFASLLAYEIFLGITK